MFKWSPSVNTFIILYPFFPFILCLCPPSEYHDLFQDITNFVSTGVVSNRSARDSKPLEVIGTLNPLPQQPTNLSDEEAKIAKPFKEISLDRSRAKYWLGVGAQPSERVWKLFSMVRHVLTSICVCKFFGLYGLFGRTSIITWVGKLD